VKQRIIVFVVALLCWRIISLAQAPIAVVNGQVRDSSGAAIAGASVEVLNDATHFRYSTETNDEGIYSVPNLPPGTYHIQVSKQGFKSVVHLDVNLNVQDAKAIGFTLPVGSVSETTTLGGGAPLINAESAAVSTVVDHQFAENLPLNGRSFQTLVNLASRVVVMSSTSNDPGRFSVNGQRSRANYVTVDGVRASFGDSAILDFGEIVGNQSTVKVQEQVIQAPDSQHPQQSASDLAKQIPRQVKEAIATSLKASNLPTTDDKRGGFHEEGGVWGTDLKAGNVLVSPAKAGPVSHPRDKYAHIEIGNAVDPSINQRMMPDGEWHIHPKGTREKEFIQPPSEVDVENAVFPINIVVGAGNNQVYFYDRLRVVAQMNLSDFLKELK